MAKDIRQIELRRLHELEKQAAYFGPNTDPAILIEIQELRTKHPDVPRDAGRRQSLIQSEFDFIANTVAAALKRLTEVEQRQQSANEWRDAQDTKLDRLLYRTDELGRWMKAGAIVMGATLVMVFVLAIVVF